MANEIGTASGLEDFFTKILKFVKGFGTTGTVSYTGTGNGLLTNLNTSITTITETWTITCTAAAANSGTFSVVGSVSGAQASATVGVAYSNSFISFLITDGATDFVVSDQFTFVTTIGAMPSVQRWTALREVRDNIAVVTSNLNDSIGSEERRIRQILRHDPRSLNTDATNSSEIYFTSGNYSAGVSFIQWQLREAKDVVKVRIKAPASFTHGPPISFRLQYSDNGSSFTTALTVVSAPNFVLNERRDFTFTSAGSHLYWKLIIDATQAASSQTSISEIVLLSAGDIVASNYGSEVILKAPGISGTDEIYVGIRSEYDIINDWYNLFLNGFTGYNSAELSWFLQPGAIAGFGATLPLDIPMVPLINSSMNYWFVADGRALRFAVKVSTNYEGGYLGWFLPYATPAQYPYPMFIGGSLVPTASSRGAPWRYSHADERHGVFPGPGGDSDPNSAVSGAAAYLRTVTGEWLSVSNRPDNSGGTDSIRSPNIGSALPFTPSGNRRAMWPHCMQELSASGNLPYREVYGPTGGYILQPCIMVQHNPTKEVYGELAGCYSISGFGNASENTGVFSGKTYVVFQNANRTTIHEYWALSLD